MITDFDAVLAGPGDDPAHGADDDLELLHERTYIVRSFRRRDGMLVVRGAVQDRKPPGLYVRDDPDPLTIHHMIVQLVVAVPSLEIVDAGVRFAAYPMEICPTITEHYRRLIGLNVARGFSRHVRELFGGSRGCTHTSALLQAMAPVVIQSMWSLRMAEQRQAERDSPDGVATPPTPEQVAALRELSARTSVNTCHVWHEDGPTIAAVRESGSVPLPLVVRTRLAELGRSSAGWPGD